jgi:DNA-binding protein YbaB
MYLTQELSLLMRKMKSMQREVSSIDENLKSVEKVSYIHQRATNGIS